MSLVKGRHNVGNHYGSRSVSDGYVARRFAHPLGELLHRAQVHFVDSLIRKGQVGSVLEIAPGPARLTAHIEAPPRAVAMDLNANMLARAAARLEHGATGRWQLCRGDAFRLPFAGPFDLVYSFRFIRHFERDDRQRLLAEIHLVLRPGGRLAFDAINAGVSRAVRHRLGSLDAGVYDAMHTRRELRAELAEAGFVVERLQGVYSHYMLQYWSQVLLGPRSERLARWAIDRLEEAGTAEPLEWIVACRRK